MDRKRFLIVGAGLSGISLAKHFIDLGHHVTLVDNGSNRSSAIAAGMINPIVFRRMTKSWRVDEFLPYAQQFYKEFGQECNATFYHPIVIRRIFSSKQEFDFWNEKQFRTDFSNYLNPLTEEDLNYSKALNTFGTGRVNQCAYVSTIEFLTESKTWISKHGQVLSESFQYELLDPETAVYKGESYSGVLFCEGVEIIHNPWFKHLPVTHTKGETLTIKSNVLPEDESLNRKCFVLPLGDHTFRIGATYVWNTYDDQTTEEGKNELFDNLRYISHEAVEVLDHKAGIRPTTMDRRPILGQHDIYDKLYVMNGLGAKGYMLAPLIAKEMVAFVLNQEPLDPECTTARYNK